MAPQCARSFRERSLRDRNDRLQRHSIASSPVTSSYFAPNTHSSHGLWGQPALMPTLSQQQHHHHHHQPQYHPSQFQLVQLHVPPAHQAQNHTYYSHHPQHHDENHDDASSVSGDSSAWGSTVSQQQQNMAAATAAAMAQAQAQWGTSMSPVAKATQQTPQPQQASSDWDSHSNW